LPWLRASLPDVRAWVDSGDAVARRVGGLLEQAGFENLPPGSTDTHGNAGIRVSFTGSPPAEIRWFMAGLGLEVTGPAR
jgi:glutamate racemase